LLLGYQTPAPSSHRLRPSYTAYFPGRQGNKPPHSPLFRPFTRRFSLARIPFCKKAPKPPPARGCSRKLCHLPPAAGPLPPRPHPARHMPRARHIHRRRPPGPHQAPMQIHPAG